MARSSRFSVNDVLQHLDSDDDNLDGRMWDGSEDDLGMDSDSDSSVEGIYYLVINIHCFFHFCK